MAEKQRKYLGNITFEGSAQEGSFGENQIQLPDISADLARNRNELWNDYERVNQRGLRDLKLEQTRDEVVYRHNARMATILNEQEARFMETASKTFQAWGTQQVNNILLKETAKGDELYYQLGKELSGKNLEDRQEYDFADEASKNLQSRVAKLIGSPAARTMPVSMLRKIINLSGTARAQFMRRYLKQEAAEIPNRMLEMRASWKGRIDSDVEADLIAQYPELAQYEGKVWNIDSDDEIISGKAYSTDLRAVLNSHMREEIFAKYDSIPRLAKAKYLFPELRKVEEQIESENVTNERKLLILEHVNNAYGDLNAAIRSGTPGDYLRIEEDLGNVLGSRRQAKNYLLKELSEGMSAGTYSLEQILNFEDTTFTHRATGKTTTIGEYLEDEMAGMDWEALKVTAANQHHELEDDQTDLLDKQLEDKMLKTLPSNTTQGTLNQIGKLFHDRTGKWPKAINTWMNAQLKDGMPIKEWLEYKRLENGGMLTEQDLQGVPYDIAKIYRDQKQVDSDGKFLASGKNLTNVEGLAKALAREEMNMTGDEQLSDNPDAVMYKNRAFDKAKEYWQKAKFAGGLSDLEALEDVRNKLDNNRKSFHSGLSAAQLKTKSQKNSKALEELQANDSSKILISGTEAEIKELEQWNSSGGRGDIPQLYKYLANRSGMGAFEFAADQYKAATGKDLIEPNIVKDIRTTDYTDKQLIHKFPSLSKFNRFFKTNVPDVEIPETLLSRAEKRNSSTGSWYNNHRKPPKGEFEDSWWNQHTIFGEGVA